MVTVNRICKEADRLIERFGTRDPFEIAEGLGIDVSYDRNIRRGEYTVLFDERRITLNPDLPREIRRIACARELAHDRFHRQYGFDGLRRIYADSKTAARPKLEADIFTAELLLDEREISEYLDYTVNQIAMIMRTEPRLVKIKFAIMKRKCQL